MIYQRDQLQPIYEGDNENESFIRNDQTSLMDIHALALPTRCYQDYRTPMIINTTPTHL